MNKIISTVILLVLLNSATAHNPQVSSISIVQNENKKWTVLVTAPLNTCQLAIQESFPNIILDSINPYKLQQLILNLIKNNIILNDDKNFKLINDKILLAHETLVYFEIQNDQIKFIPNKVEFKAFSKLRDHFTVLKIVSYGQKEINFILNSENDFTYPTIKKKETNIFQNITFVACLLTIALMSIVILITRKFYK